MVDTHRHAESCAIHRSDRWVEAVGIVYRAETNVCTIPNVCSDSACFTLAESVDRASPRVLFLGRLEMEKGFNDLLLAIAHIRDRIPGKFAG